MNRIQTTAGKRGRIKNKELRVESRMGDSNRKERFSKASEKDGKMKGGKSTIREIRRASERQAKSRKKGSRGKKRNQNSIKKRA